MDSNTAHDRDQYGSAADYAYAMLREEIVSGRFASGRRMREVELATLLGISRTPTRLALSRLENEGLLELKPRLGLVVASLDYEAMEELYEMRAALEGTAAALAARHASTRDLDVLRQLIAEEASLSTDPALRHRHNRLFHSALYQAAHNRFLMKSLEALHNAIALLGPTTMAGEERLAAAHAEHAAVVDAIIARDPARADATMRHHILQALALRRARLEQSARGASRLAT